MVFSPSNPTEASTRRSDASSVPTYPHLKQMSQMDTEQVFRLIDGILPFEACLYHQVLPIALEGSRLRLGMVSLDDSAALNYVRRILAYMNCSLAPERITSESHHAILTAYLNYAGKQKPASEAASSPLPDTVSPDRSSLVKESVTQPQMPEAKGSRPTVDRNTAPTLLVDSPQDLSDLDPPDVAEAPTIEPETEEPAVPLSSEEDLRSRLPGNALPVLDVDTKHASGPLDVLATLPPKQLAQELLGRISVGGIGRLYFEQQAQYGRILWSQNGVLQSVLEKLPPETIRGVIAELKRLTRMPQAPVQKPKQVEIERLHQNSRLLLRLRVMPGAHGEEATLQILRGAALKFYQRQQLATLSRDALTIGQELQRKVNELRSRTRFYPMLTSEQLSILPELHEVLRSVDQQLEALRSLQADAPSEEDSSAE